MKKYFLQLKKPIAIQLIFTLLYAVTTALFPMLNGYLFDNILDEGLSLIPLIVLGYLFLILLNCSFQYVARIYEWVVSKDFNIRIRKDLFKNVIHIKYSDFKKEKPSDYLSIFNNNIEAIGGDYISAHIDLIKTGINIIVFSAAMIIFVNWKITVLVFIMSLMAVFVPKIMEKKLSKSRKEQLFALRSYFSKILDLLNGKKRINLFTAHRFEKVHSDSLTNTEKKRYTFGKIKTQSDMLNAIGVFIIELSTFSFIAYFLASGEITIGEGVATLGYVTSFLYPINEGIDCVNCINSTKDTVKETMEYLKYEPMDLKKDYKLKEIKNLSLKNVSFKTEQFSLKSFDFNFEKGKKYAIIGHSGSGKSTLLRLIDGSIELEEGSITIDSKDINSIHRDEFIFSVDQFEHLFDTDYKNNITVFESMKDERKLAAKLIEKLNKITKNKLIKYENIQQLSGGERQIISILRMLVANRPIILLDESFSSIDKNNIKLIKDYLMGLKNQIIIEVTHDTTKENLSKYDGVISFNEGIGHLSEVT